jgi:hypothetical protein
MVYFVRSYFAVKMQMDLYNTHNGHGTITFTAVVIVVFKDIVQPKKRGGKEVY